MKATAILVICLGAIAVARPRDAGVDSACAAEGSEGLLVPHENCNRFYECSGGLPVAQDCPAGLLYNVEARLCDWPGSVDCGDRSVAELAHEEVHQPWAPQHGHSDPSQAPAICAAPDSDGTLVAHENCHRFYKCFRGEPVAIDCPSPLLYHPELEICDWPENVDCSGRVN